MTPEERIRKELSFLYGRDEGERWWASLETRIEDFRRRRPELSSDVRPISRRLTERDAILITYGDQFSEPGRPPLQTLASFLHSNLGKALSGVHILPFFPYSSDDGFSIIDYRKVNPELGTWEDIALIGRHFRLMFDGVVNHISRKSEWFQRFLRGERPYTDYFITVSPDTDLSTVVRPRDVPLLTPVETAKGTRFVWTTFSSDQIDLNYHNPDVLLEMTDLLLFYVEKGAQIIRLDAIAYLWKEIGTSCIHLPQTHAVVRLWRAVLDAVAPGVLIITETNVPHEENISYFGSYLPETGTSDEAQMVYNFSLAPLTMHSFLTGDATALADWADDLRPTVPGTTFFNFIASHDGIGVMPAKGILTDDEILALVDRTLAHGGRVSYKANHDGSRSVYELNITLYDFLNDPDRPNYLDVDRFMASQVILLSLAGVPGIYVHSLFGSRNCHRCFEETGRARSLNREKFQMAELKALLSNPVSHQSKVFPGYRRLLEIRREHPAFHPFGRQNVLRVDRRIFALLRESPDGSETVLCLVNVSEEEVPLEVNAPFAGEWHDLIGGDSFSTAHGMLEVTSKPYQAMWLRHVG